MDDFPSFAFELRIIAVQNLAPKKVKEYLEIVFREKGFRKSHDVMRFILLVHGKHLQMMVAYTVFKEDPSAVQDRVMKLFDAFNKDYAALIMVFENVTGSPFMPGQFVDLPGNEALLPSNAVLPSERSSVDQVDQLDRVDQVDRRDRVAEPTKAAVDVPVDSGWGNTFMHSWKSSLFAPETRNF